MSSSFAAICRLLLKGKISGWPLPLNSFVDERVSLKRDADPTKKRKEIYFRGEGKRKRKRKNSFSIQIPTPRAAISRIKQRQQQQVLPTRHRLCMIHTYLHYILFRSCAFHRHHGKAHITNTHFWYRRHKHRLLVSAYRTSK